MNNIDNGSIDTPLNKGFEKYAKQKINSAMQWKLNLYKSFFLNFLCLFLNNRLRSSDTLHVMGQHLVRRRLT